MAVILVLMMTVLGGGAVFVWQKTSAPALIEEPIPSAQVYVSPTISPSLSPILDSKIKIPDSINLAVPFTSQAPHKNWQDPYGELCEEASVLMAASYINGWTIPDPDYADKKLFDIKAFEEERFGYYKDTTAEETAVILKEFYGIKKVAVVYDPTADDIKRSLAEKKVVIIPAAGRLLGNPYFRRPGPLYHALVIKGYTKEGNFITNDPGTQHGADFIYSPDVLMNAVHDWNGGDVPSGRKVMIVVG